MWQTEFGNSGWFIALLHHPKNQNFKKIRKIAQDIILHMCTKTHNHEVQFLRCGVRDRIFSHFGLFLPFYPPNNPENQNFEKMKKESGDDIILHMCTKITIIMYASWNKKCNWHIFFFLSFWAIFCSYTLLKWTINKNHMLYDSWDMKRAIVCSFTPITQKIKNLKKWKKTPGVIIILQVY